jgi:hypothetical protein
VVQLHERFLRQVGREIRFAGEAIQEPEQPGEVRLEEGREEVIKRLRCLGQRILSLPP